MCFERTNATFYVVSEQKWVSSQEGSVCLYLYDFLKNEIKSCLLFFNANHFLQLYQTIHKFRPHGICNKLVLFLSNSLVFNNSKPLLSAYFVSGTVFYIHCLF